MEVWFERWQAQTTIAQGWHIPGYEVREHVHGGLYVCGAFFDGDQGQWVNEVMSLDDFLQLAPAGTGLNDLFEGDRVE